MGAVTQTKRVEGTAYEITQFPATRANKLLVRFMKLVGPSLGDIFSIDQAKAKSLDPEETKKIGSALQKLAMNVNENEWDELTKELLSSVLVGSACVADDFDTRFQGKLFQAYMLLGQVLWVNYEDFFAGLAQQKRQAKAGSLSTSPSI